MNEGKRRDKVQLLLSNSREGKRPDYAVARKWREGKRHNEPSVHFHQPTITDSTVVGSVGINEGTLSTKIILKAKNKDDVRSDLDEIDEFLQSPNERQSNRFTKKLRTSINDYTSIQNVNVQIEPINRDSGDDTTFHDSENEDVDEDVSEDEEDADDDVDEELSEINMSEFKDLFSTMSNDKKWYLQSGKCVEDALYNFGLRCKFGHLAHSFILDPDDETFIQKEIFTHKELEEIRDTQAKKLPDMPDDLLKYVGSFRKRTAKDLRVALDTRQEWEGENYNKVKHFNFDWVKNTVHCLLFEYEFETLQRKHLEAWYNVHIWSMIDKSFNELEGVDVTRGESCSFASSKRKNKNRIVQGIMKTARKALGRRGDLILRKGVYEYGASEVGKDYEGENGTKLLKERGLKSPKMLKDMLVDLGNFVEWDESKLRQLELVSFIHAGLHMILLRMDVPVGYVCRISRSETLQIPTSVKRFEDALKCMVLTWKAKAIISKTINIVEGIIDDDDNLEDLQGAGVRGGVCKRENLTIIPNCIKTPLKRRR